MVGGVIAVVAFLGSEVVLSPVVSLHIGGGCGMVGRVNIIISRIKIFRNQNYKI